MHKEKTGRKCERKIGRVDGKVVGKPGRRLRKLSMHRGRVGTGRSGLAS